MRKLLCAALSSILLVIVLMPASCASKTMEVEIIPSESNRWLELLRVLPENENTIKATYLSDIPYMIEKIPGKYAIGINLPLFERWIMPQSESDNELQETLGFRFADVEQTIYSGVLPFYYYQAVRGNFSREAVDSVVKTGPMNELLEIVLYQGQEFYSWDGDFEVHVQYRSNVRPLGRGYRLALIDDFILWVQWSNGMKEMIDSYQDKIKSLADNENYRMLAGALENLDTVNAFFSAESHSLGHFYEVLPREKLNEELAPEMRDRLFAELDNENRLRPYQALATGIGKDDKGYYLAIALVNVDEATARNNAKLLEQRINVAKIVWGFQAGQKWSNLTENVVIKSNGCLTLAKLYGPVVEFWDYFEILGGGFYEPLLISD